MTRPTVQSLICEGLGYCCEYAFFRLHRQTGLIAARLGINPRTVRYHKQRFKEKEMKCENCAKCLKGRLF